MADVRTFNSYNFVTGAVDGTLAYDFSNPALYQDEEIYDEPKKRRGRRQRAQEQEWIREDVREQTRAHAVARDLQGISLLSIGGVLVVVVLLTLMLLAQIRLTDISDTAAHLEEQIAQLELEKDKLTVQYETIFNLKDVEAIAVDQLGMQEPEEEQVFYLTGVSAADKAVVVTQDETDMFSLGLQDLIASAKAYFS